jgi:predicted phosphodiesterase
MKYSEEQEMMLRLIWPCLNPGDVSEIFGELGINTNKNALGKRANMLGVRFISHNPTMALDRISRSGLSDEMKDAVKAVVDINADGVEKQDIISGLKKRIKELEYGNHAERKKAEILACLAEHEYRPSPDWLNMPKKSGSHHATPVLFISDTHVPEVVNADMIRGVNEYNYEIAEARLKEVISGAIKICRVYTAGVEIDGIVVMFGGDLFTGFIHEELRRTAKMNLLPSLIKLHDMLIGALESLREEFGYVSVKCVVGNHGRIDLKPQHKTYVEDNFEWLLYKMIEGYFKTDERVHVEVATAPEIMFDVYKTRILLTHGHQIKGGQGLTGLINTVLRNEIKLNRQFAFCGPEYHFDLLCLAHFHQLVFLQNLVVNGSIIGYTEYANSILAQYQPPQQALFFITPERGKTIQVPIFCNREG